MHQKSDLTGKGLSLFRVSRAVCFAAFALGSVFGTICGSSSKGSAAVVVNSALDRFLGYITERDIASALFFSGISLASCVLVFLSSLFVFGSICVPAVLFFKAFSFSYSCAAVLGCAGSGVFKLFLFYCACDVLIFIPACIYLAVRSFEYSCRLFGKTFTGRIGKAYDAAYVRVFSAFIPTLGAAFLIQYYLIPLLAGALSAGPLRNLI
jgi:hypothetical protein